MQSHADTLESTCEAMAEPSADDPHDRVVSDYEARLDAELVVLRSMRVALAATQHMLEAMRDAHLRRRFVHRGRAHPCPNGNRPHTRSKLREYGQSVVECRLAEPGGVAVRAHHEIRHAP